jgi:hypothetical protein
MSRANLADHVADNLRISCLAKCCRDCRKKGQTLFFYSLKGAAAGTIYRKIGQSSLSGATERERSIKNGIEDIEGKARLLPFKLPF